MNELLEKALDLLTRMEAEYREYSRSPGGDEWGYGFELLDHWEEHSEEIRELKKQAENERAKERAGR